MAAKRVEESPPLQTLKYQTWVLRVFIHCEACKKKVKKVLQAIDGVYTTEFDSQQHTVTVTGNVDSETLLKKLLRSGKYAEILPGKPQKKNNKSAKSKSGDKENQGNKKNNNEPIADDQQKDDVAGDKESEKEDSEFDEAGETNGGEGGKKKKKKKKKNKGQNVGAPDNGDEESIGEAQPVNGPSLAAAMASMNLNHPVQQSYRYPQMHYSPQPVPPPQVYGLSYNAANPSFSTPYYAPHMHAYYATYSHLPPPPPPANPIKHYSDDDDNRGCSIM